MEYQPKNGLVISSRPAASERISQVLLKRGYDVFEADTLEAAELAIRNRGLQLVLVDHPSFESRADGVYKSLVAVRLNGGFLIVVVGVPTVEADRLFKFGVDDVAPGPMALENLEARIPSLERRIEAERKLRGMFEEAPVAYVQVGRDGLIQHVNEIASALLGYPPGALVGKPVVQLYDGVPASQNKAEALFERFLSGIEIKDQLLDLRRPDGEFVCVRLSVTPVFDRYGDVVASRSILMDVTETIKAQSELKNLARRAANQADRFRLVAKIAALISRHATSNEIQQACLEGVLQVIDCDRAVIAMVDEDSGELRVTNWLGCKDAVEHGLPPGKRLPSRADLDRGSSHHTGSLMADMEFFEQSSMGSVAVVPIKVEGSTAGAIQVCARGPNAFAGLDIELLQLLANQVGVSLEGARRLDLAREMDSIRSLLSVSKSVASSLTLSEILERAVDLTAKLTGLEAVEIWLLDDEGEGVSLEAQAGLPVDGIFGQSTFRFGEGFPGEMARNSRRRAISDPEDIASVTRAELNSTQMVAICGIPMMRGESLVGVLIVGSNRKLNLDIFERRLLDGIAEIVAFAVENSHLHTKVADQAMVEERTRIAHGMHDSLVQSLSITSVKAATISALVTDGKYSEAKAASESLREASLGLTDVVREEIFDLRFATLAAGSFHEMITDYLNVFSDTNDFDIQVEGLELVGELGMHRWIESQIIRIIQEALRNVLKHADVSEARVSFSSSAGMLCLAVEDNGRGFEHEELGGGQGRHYGLPTMRERAASFGGRLRVRTSPGHGCKVLVEVPINDQGGRKWQSRAF